MPIKQALKITICSMMRNSFVPSEGPSAKCSHLIKRVDKGRCPQALQFFYIKYIYF